MTMSSFELLIGQVILGLINGSFYAMLSLGLAVIFGLLNIVNFTHGTQYMLGAYTTLLLMRYGGVGYWWALAFAPILIGLFGILFEKTILRLIYGKDHMNGLLLTLGVALIIEGIFQNYFGSSGVTYPVPELLTGGVDIGFFYFPYYRIWVVAASALVCLSVWLVVEKTKFGSILRAATENSALVDSFGINVPLLITLTYGLGVGLAAFAGVLAAPIYQISPQMGSAIVINVFAVVVIGGMGSIVGAILTGYGVGLIEGLTKAFYPEASSTAVFVVMAIVLLIRPAGLFGRTT